MQSKEWFSSLDLSKIPYSKCNTRVLLKELELVRKSLFSFEFLEHAYPNWYVVQILSLNNNAIWLKRKFKALKKELSKREHIMNVPEGKEARRNAAMQNHGSRKNKNKI